MQKWIKIRIGISWGKNMKGMIALAFFSLFLVASLLIPAPMFPGSWFCTLMGQAARDYVSVLSALFNGIFYGVVLWAVFIGLSRKLSE
jgi:hypothetical protein